MKGKEQPWYTWVADQGGNTRVVGQAPKGKGKGKGKQKKGPKGDDPFAGRDLDAELEEIASRPAGKGFTPYVRGAEIPPPAEEQPPGPKGTYGAIRRGGEGWGSDEQWT